MKKRLLIPGIIILLLTACILYVSDYYHAAENVRSYLNGEGNVKAIRITEGVYLDGPGSGNAFIFYPGGKVEYTAYLPLLYRIAESGTDCFLVKMPANLAILKKNKADSIIAAYGYQRWYIGGHSLGGAAAAMYCAEHDLEGLILLAAYPTVVVDEKTLELYGSEDQVLNRGKRVKGDQLLPEGSLIYEIEGGNHSQFGDYGEQKGDGTAGISREKQQDITAEMIEEFIGENT